MKKLISWGVLFLALCCINTPSLAKDIKLKTGHPIQYTVKPGDTLWEIAARFLDDPLQWQTLFQTNPQVENPYKIYPGQVLELQITDGHPALYSHTGGTVKLYPMVRSTQMDDAIPVIPLDQIKPFLSGTRVVEKGQLSDAPFIIAQQGEHVVTGAGDKIFVEGIEPSSPFTKYWIFRQSKPYIDPKTGDNLGYAADHVGQAELLAPAKAQVPSSMLITQANKEVHKGDRLLPRSATVELKDFQPRIPGRLINGDIISVLDGVTQIGQFDVVVIDRGSNDDLAPGDLLAVFQRGATVENPVKRSRQRTITLPNTRAGEMMIFRVFDRVSYGLILHATQPMHINDVVQTPEI